MLASQITNLNPALAGEAIDLYADARDPTRTHRPFLICNSAMFLKEPNTALELLAPVQITPFITGIFGTPMGVDGNGSTPGGGGVNTFGFNSAYINASSSAATVAQTRQWSLTDAVGTSSAFFAEVLQNLFRGWRQNPADLAALVARNADTIEHWIRTKLPIEARGAAAELLRVNAHPLLGQPLLQGLWAASGSGSYAHPAIFPQRLVVRPNTWFSVTFAREVSVIWSYLNFVLNGRRCSPITSRSGQLLNWSG